MRTLSTREIVLAIFLVGVIAFFAWRWHGGEAAEASRGGTHAAQAAFAAGADLPLLALDRASDLPSVDDAKLRNLFNYSKSPDEYEAERLEAERIKKLAAEAERRRREEQERAAKEADERAKWAREHPAPPPAPTPPEMSFKFLGYLGKPADKLAVLSDTGGGGDIHSVRAGEGIDGKFKVLQIDYETMTLGYTDPKFSQEQKILRMGG